MQQPSETVKLIREIRGVTTITLARPSVLNAFDEMMIDKLTQAFVQAHEDDATRCVVLAAEGAMFSAGADIEWMQRQSGDSPDANLQDARRFADMLRAVYECAKPVVVRVQGHVYGGGVGLVAAADVVVAAREVSFCISEARFGILPAVIGPYITEAMGARQAMRLAIEATRFSADQALALNLVQKVVSAADLDLQVEKSVAGILANGPQAVREIKMLYRRMSGAITPEIREFTAQTIARVRGSDEAKEGFGAFLQKRKPNWASS